MKPYHTKLNWLYITGSLCIFCHEGISDIFSVWFSIEVGCELWASGRFTLTKNPIFRHFSWKNIIRIHDVVVKQMLDFSKLPLLWSNLFPAEHLQGWLPFVEASPVVGDLVQLVRDLVEGGPVGWFRCTQNHSKCLQFEFWKCLPGIFPERIIESFFNFEIDESIYVGGKKHLPFSES